ncbi:hypothetical protein [Krasilnikovia sp. MM14-A1004]|uniref:hypothetical protein n=1 Tax=Krasilnikovia sp. MM14-A1004 TaxID=3373541 RepID=UPI00399CC5C7
MSPVKTAPAELTAGDAALRAQYLTEVLGLLYPPPCTAHRGRAAGETVAEYVVVPDARRPRLLVPTSRRVAAAAVRRYAEPQSRTARLKRDAVVAALRTGMSGVLLRDRIRVTGPVEESIDGHLREALGRELSVSIHIGPARANRKPVLQLISPAGETFGFGKLGTGPLTQRLVREETNALVALGAAGLSKLTVPRVLHAGQWRGLQVLVQSALPVWLPRAPLTPRRLAAAMLDVAGCCGYSTATLTASPYWGEVRGRLAAVADRAEGRALATAADLLAGRVGGTMLRFGAWHGDWAPWNMANLADALLVWDWERFATGVPVGFDAVHYELQRRIQADGDAAGAVDATVRRAGELLAPFGLATEVRELTALLYLVDLAARYLTDRQAEAGARLGVLGTWLLPVLIRRVEEL